MQNDKEYLDGLDESEKVALKSKLLNGIRKGISEESARKAIQDTFWRKTKIAASFSLIILAAFSTWIWTGANEVIYQTSANEVLNLILPDSSSVILNSNSTLAYKTSRFTDFNRKVTLEGEAFFSIQKDNNGELFEINEESDLRVTVLGTQFSVKNSDNLNKVILVEGSVKLDYSNQGNSSEYLMTPGEAIKLTKDHQIESRRFDNPEILTSWKNRKLKLNDDTLAEVLIILAEIYDLTPIEEGKQQDSNRVSGSLPLTDDPNEVLLNLEILFDTKVEIKGDQIFIRGMKP